MGEPLGDEDVVEGGREEPLRRVERSAGQAAVAGLRLPVAGGRVPAPGPRAQRADVVVAQAAVSEAPAWAAKG